MKDKAHINYFHVLKRYFFKHANVQLCRAFENNERHHSLYLVRQKKHDTVYNIGERITTVKQ